MTSLCIVTGGVAHDIGRKLLHHQLFLCCKFIPRANIAEKLFIKNIFQKNSS